MSKVILISFDALGDTQFPWMEELPNFKKFISCAEVHRNAETVFLSNTYPIHASVVTGVHPQLHGITSNVEPIPKEEPIWYSDSRRFKSKPLWTAAKEKGLKTAAVMWPVTAFSKDITYNIPEVLARKGKSQVLTSLKAGSKRLQVQMVLRHGKHLNGAEQPQLDSFSAACMKDIIKRKRPDLMLLHLTCYDTMCHMKGPVYEDMKPALKSLDDCLGEILSVLDSDTTVILFSDHSQLAVDKVMNPNRILQNMGLLEMDEAGNISRNRCFIECCGGSGFLYKQNLLNSQLKEIKAELENSEGFGRYLTPEEVKVSGRKRAAFGFSAKPGYCYEVSEEPKKGNHGYPLDYKDYRVFYAVKGKQYLPGVYEGGSLLDIAPIAARELDLNMPLPLGETI